MNLNHWNAFQRMLIKSSNRCAVALQAHSLKAQLHMDNFHQRVVIKREWKRPNHRHTHTHTHSKHAGSINGMKMACAAERNNIESERARLEIVHKIEKDENIHNFMTILQAFSVVEWFSSNIDSVCAACVLM